MKSVLITSLFFLLLTAISQAITAQSFYNTRYASATTSQQKKILRPGNSSIINEPKAVYINDINSKALRDFTRTYKNITDAKWYITDSGFVVYFTRDSVKTHVFYNKKGNYQNSISYYYENRLPKDIRHFIRSTYYDFRIFHISEVHADNRVAYLVMIEDNACWKTIKVVNGEIEVVDTIKKTS